MIHNWSSAYIQQAFSDYKMFTLIENMDDVEDAQKIYFLQKVGEKAAQSYWTDGTSPPTKDHEALLGFFKAVKTDPLLRARVSKKMKLEKFLKKVGKVEAYAKELHRLVARNEKSANCEYPWVDTHGVIQVPSETTFSVFGPGNATPLHDYIALFETWFDASGLSGERRAWRNRLNKNNPVYP